MYKDANATILIVDDKAGNIFALEEVLARPGRNFVRATNGNEALKTMLGSDIDLIILDVQMPDMDGFEVARILKSHKRTKDIPIIFASAEKKEHKFMMQGFGEGAFDYLYKPLDPAITEAKVSVLLELHLSRKELLSKNIILEKYALLINNSADLICIINARTLKFEQVNDAAITLLGYPAEQLHDSSLLPYLDDEGRQVVQEAGIADKEKFSFETRINGKDGSVRWLNWNVVSKDGLWFANARDITGKKLAEQEIRQLNAELNQKVVQLEATNKELESFSYSVSHDLRAPLRSINGYAGIILEDHAAQLDDELRRLLDIIQGNAGKMGVLIDSLLEFSRLGRRSLKQYTVDMTELVQRGLRDLEDSHAGRVTISIGALPKAEGDPVLLYQVVVNLLSNAIKYSRNKPAPVIEIGSTDNENELIYYIKDNGAGFNMEYAHKLFGVFQRLHGDDEFEGTGVGLALVQRIIARHGGRVWAEGQPGQGATFYFSLPKPQLQKNHIPYDQR